MSRIPFRVSCVVLLFALAMVGRTDAQPALRFSGYVMDFAAGQFPAMQGVDDAASNLARLRLRPLMELWEGGTLALEHESTLLWMSRDGVASLAYRDIAPRQAVDLRWHPVAENKLHFTHAIDRLYLRQNVSWGTFILGRQRIQWGTGRIWNPTDLFHPLNPAAYDKIEKDGADAFTAKFHLGDFTDVQFVYNFRPAMDSANVGARFRTNVEEFDLSAMAGYFDRRSVLGADMAGNAFGAGVRAEVLWMDESREGRGNDFVRYILGMDYQISAELYVLMEYFRNGEGAARTRDYDLGRLYLGEIVQLARSYLYLGGGYQLHPLLYATGGVNFNLNDNSLFVQASALWSTGDNSAVHVGTLLPVADTGDEYWYYPASVYVRGEFHF